MYSLIIGLIIFVAVLLVLAVLAQNAKGGGLSGQFGGAGTNQLMGVKRTSDLLEQITWGLALTLIVLTVSTSFILPDQADGGINSVNVERAQPTAPLPQQSFPLGADTVAAPAPADTAPAGQ
jgi:preprotein translocase subunit SecG